jgi:hypothetical protein
MPNSRRVALLFQFNRGQPKIPDPNQAAIAGTQT